MSTAQSRTVPCPNCGVDVVWSEQNLHRPFCSARCRDTDFIGWAKEEHKIGGDNDYDDLLSGDLSED